MKHFIVLLYLLVVSDVYGQAAPGAIFAGENIKLLKKNQIFSGSNVRLMTGDTDIPSAVAKSAEQGSLYFQASSSNIYQKQDDGLSTNWNLLVMTSGSGTDECVARWNGTGTSNLQDSALCITDLGVGSGLSELHVGNITASGNTIFTTGSLILDPSDYVIFNDLLSDRVMITGPSKEATSSVVTTTELSYVSGVTSGIQAQIDSKYANSGQTANKLVVTDSSGNVTESALVDYFDASGSVIINGQLSIDNLRVDGNSISSEDANGSIIVNPNGAGAIQFPDLTASTPLKLDASSNVIASDVDLTTDITGVLPLANGGTNKSLVAANGSIPYSDVDSFEFLAAGTLGQPIVSGGVGAPTWFSSSGVVKASSGVLSASNVDLTTEVTGILPITNGGTNSSTALNNGRLLTSVGGSVVESTNATYAEATGILSLTGQGNFDNLRLDGNTLSSEDASGSIILNPNGSGQVNLPDLATSRALITDASSNIIVSSTTATELGYVSGVTSSIQSQLDGKLTSTLANGKIWIGSSDGSGYQQTPSGDITISNAGITAIVSGSIIDADISNSASISAIKIAGGGVTNTEFNYLNGVTSSVQTQLDGKLSTTVASGSIIVGNGSAVGTVVDMTGDIDISNAGVTAINSDVIVNADVNTAANIDATKLGTGVVSNTEFNYVDGVTSAIQGQLDSTLLIDGSRPSTGMQTFNGGISAASQSVIRFYEQSANGSNYSSIKAYPLMSGNVDYILPQSDGASGSVLTTGGNGSLSWTTGGAAIQDDTFLFWTETGDGVSGQTTSADTIQTATITNSSGGSAFASLATNTITLQPGTYHLHVLVPFNSTDRSSSYWYRPGDSTYLRYGETVVAWASSSGSSHSVIDYVWTIASQTDYTIRFYTALANGFIGANAKVSAQDPGKATNIFLQGTIRKLTP